MASHSMKDHKSIHDLTIKVNVNCENTAPVFGDDIKWNFSKFLVDQDGHVVDRYAPTTSPLSIEKHIKKLLGVS